MLCLHIYCDFDFTSIGKLCTVSDFVELDFFPDVLPFLQLCYWSWKTVRKSGTMADIIETTRGMKVRFSLFNAKNLILFVILRLARYNFTSVRIFAIRTHLLLIQHECGICAHFPRLSVDLNFFRQKNSVRLFSLQTNREKKCGKRELSFMPGS